jgi:hypothetical protein
MYGDELMIGKQLNTFSLQDKDENINKTKTLRPTEAS